MTREPNESEEILRSSMDPQFRGRLLARGQAQSMIRRKGVLPEEAPEFEPLLDYDLLNYGYSMLATGLRVVDELGSSDIARDAFFQTSNALEAATRNAGPSENLHFHRLVAGAASHLGGYTARAYSLVLSSVESGELTGTEKALADLIRRSLESIETQTIELKTSESMTDEAILRGLSEQGEASDVEALPGSGLDEEPGDDAVGNNEDHEADPQDAVSLLLTENYLSGLSAALFALAYGEEDAFTSAIKDLRLGQEVCGDLAMVGPWWVHRLSVRLLADLAATSIRAHIPVELSRTPDEVDWPELREDFIATLFARDRAEIDLWPSQLNAVDRVFDSADDLVISLPTSSGKTRLAELCILACLGRGKRVIYVTPLRALSAQTELILEATFNPLGARVSSLYGSMGTSDFDEDVLRTSEIVVATPEKLDFALRSDPSLLDDVGLVVLDEGHMIGTSDREVRYEAQIQRLLRRSDADARRLVCLSAVLPAGEELNDFVNWITDDAEDGGLITEDWRPTQQRFGLVEWNDDHARMVITVGTDRPFIPRYVEARRPPGKQRKKQFPSSQRELVLATASRLVEEQQSVLIFCPQRNSVEPYAREVVRLHRQGLFPSLLPDGADLSTALAVGAEWFGEGHPVLRSLELGVVIHHGALPAPYRREVERLLRTNVIQVTVASPTLAQGLNLSASTVLFHGVRRGRLVIPGSEFRNVIGRAGRAFVDTEGLVLYPVYEPTVAKRQEWLGLIADSAGKALRSGLIGVTRSLIQRMLQHLGSREIEPFIEYLTSRGGWELPVIVGEDPAATEEARGAWEGNLARLDTSILSTVGDEDADGALVADILAGVLHKSLWERQLEHFDGATKDVLREVVLRRSEDMWSQSTPAQRRGWYLSGLGMNAGRQLDQVAADVVGLLIQVEAALAEDEFAEATDLIVEVASAIFNLAPFAAENKPENWEEVLRQWVAGGSLADLADGQMTTAQFIESDVIYRLSWGMEAVRVYQAAQGDTRAMELTGAALAVVETGTFNRAASALIRVGFDFRSAAIEAVESTGAAFLTARDVRRWLRSLDSRFLGDPTWPTPESREVWTHFVQRARRPSRRRWVHETRTAADVQWSGTRPRRREWMRVTDDQDGTILLWTGGFQFLGSVSAELNPGRQGVIRARRIRGGVEFDYRGPRDLGDLRI